MWSGPAAWASLTASTTMRGEVDLLLVERPAGVEAREQQQVVDQDGHPGRLGLDPAERVGDRRGHRLALAAGQLGVPADRGERRAQLVAGVGDELAHPRLALLPRGQRGVDVVSSPLRAEPDLADLGARVGVGCGHPLGQGDLAAVQRRCETRVAVAATRRSGRRVRRASHGRRPRRPGEPEAGDDGDDEREPLDRVVLRSRSAARSRSCRRGSLRRAGWRRAGSCPARRPGPPSSAAGRRRRARTVLTCGRCQRGVLARGGACRVARGGRPVGHLQQQGAAGPARGAAVGPRGAGRRRPAAGGPSWSSPPAASARGRP